MRSRAKGTLAFHLASTKLLTIYVILLWTANSVSISHAVQVANVEAADSSQVLAFLGEQPITYGDVDFQLARRTGAATGKSLPALPPAVLQSTIYLIAQQRQALQTLRAQRLATKREEVERWIAERLQTAADEKLPVADFIRREAQSAGITEAAYREHFAFRLSWQQYLQQHLTDKNVAKHFENQKSRFDGTRFRIASVAIAVPAGESQERDAAVTGLTELRNKLLNGTIDWGELQQAKVAQILESLPGISADRLVVSKERWIRGTGDQHPAIVTELLDLKVQEISQPIATPTGVYLVKLFEKEAGSRALLEVRDEVRADMLLYLLDHLASQSRPQLPLRAIE